MPPGIIRRECDSKHADYDASVTLAPPSPIAAAVRKFRWCCIETALFQYSQKPKTRKPSMTEQEATTTEQEVIQKLEDVFFILF
jgi:hypothetical protein